MSVRILSRQGDSMEVKIEIEENGIRLVSKAKITGIYSDGDRLENWFGFKECVAERPEVFMDMKKINREMWNHAETWIMDQTDLQPMEKVEVVAQ